MRRVEIDGANFNGAENTGDVTVARFDRLVLILCWSERRTHVGLTVNQSDGFCVSELSIWICVEFSCVLNNLRASDVLNRFKIVGQETSTKRQSF